MNNKKAKRIKRKVVIDMYVGDDVTIDNVKKDKHSVYNSPDFKPVYRSAKKNNMAAKRRQYPNHMKKDTGYDQTLKLMLDQRLKKKKQ